MIFLKLFLAFFVVGLFTFGGGYAMIPLIKDIVLKEQWLSEEDFLSMIALSEVTPGPIAINMATYLGSTVARRACGGVFWAGLLGSLLATIGVVLPAFLIMLLVTWLLRRFMNNRYVQGLLDGIKPVAVALIIAAGLSLLLTVLLPHHYDKASFHLDLFVDPMSLRIFLFVGFFVFLLDKVFKRKTSPIMILLLGGIIGLAVNLLRST